MHVVGNSPYFRAVWNKWMPIAVERENKDVIPWKVNGEWAVYCRHELELDTCCTRHALNFCHAYIANILVRREMVFLCQSSCFMWEMTERSPVGIAVFFFFLAGRGLRWRLFVEINCGFCQWNKNPVLRNMRLYIINFQQQVALKGIFTYQETRSRKAELLCLVILYRIILTKSVCNKTNR